MLFYPSHVTVFDMPFGWRGREAPVTFFFLHVWFVGTFCCLFASLWCNYISCVTEKKKGVIRLLLLLHFCLFGGCLFPSSLHMVCDTSPERCVYAINPGPFKAA